MAPHRLDPTRSFDDIFILDSILPLALFLERDERKTSQKTHGVFSGIIRDSNSTSFFDLPAFVSLHSSKYFLRSSRVRPHSALFFVYFTTQEFRVFIKKEGTFRHSGNATLKAHTREYSRRVVPVPRIAREKHASHSWRVAMVPPDRSCASCASRHDA